MLNDFESIIINIISDVDYTPVDHYKLYNYYKDNYDESAKYDEFMSEIARLERDFLITVTTKGKIMLPDNSNVLRGEFKSTSKGFGFVTPTDEKTSVKGDIYISQENTMNALNGDVVAVMLMKSGTKYDRSKFKSVGKIIRVIEHSLKSVIGTLTKMSAGGRKNQNNYYVIPDDPKIHMHVIVDSSLSRDVTATVGSKVEIVITQYPSENTSGPARAYGKIVNVFGNTDTLEANYNAILYEHNIKLDFDKDTLDEAEMRANVPLTADGRLDLRDKIIFTIDGEDAKDLDDAISVERTDNGYILGVHIADVSEYVKPNSAIDIEAFTRGTSVYFADQVVPMLPQCLSNGVCSLTSGHDRYALSALITLSDKGEILECSLAESIISTAVRGVYSELNDIIAHGNDSDFHDKYKMILPDTLNLVMELYAILDKNSSERGCLNFDTTESKIIIGEDNTVTDIVKRDRGITERVIEQFMLCANEAVANWLYWQSMPCVYRVHDEPSPDKIHEFSIFAYNLGLNVSSIRAKTIFPSALQRILDQAKDRDMDSIVSFVMLRSMMKARYSAVVTPHFGLAIDMYCHFTSPIRRYPDLIVHRIVKLILHGEADEDTINQYTQFTEIAAKQSTDTEVKAVMAERDIEDLYKCVYMSDKVGETFTGIISSVTSFGFFVELDNTCEGLVPVSSLKGYFEFDSDSLRLYCGYRSYNLGDIVEVTVEKVDIIRRRVDMVLA
jgi:ribonuclease R